MKSLVPSKGCEARQSAEELLFAAQDIIADKRADSVLRQIAMGSVEQALNWLKACQACDGTGCIHQSAACKRDGH